MRLFWVVIGLVVAITGCYRPPYNDFRPYHRTPKDMAIGAGAGAIVGAATGPVLAGTGIGALAITAAGLYQESRGKIIQKLRKAHIQYVSYGSTNTLILPTDRYFRTNTAELTESCYYGMWLTLKLLQYYKHSQIYVAGFTDNIGSRNHQKRLSQARADAILTYLWANGIAASRLDAQGYGKQHDIADNSLVHGSAQNRRIEIQWFNPPRCIAAASMMK